MKYPTMEEVEAATREQLGRWWRFLPSPGGDFLKDNQDTLVDEDFQRNFDEIMRREAEIMDRIDARFWAMGMFTSELSRKIGWDREP